jgi:uncharacterized protein YbjT (DUF2867 family)
MKVLLLGATGAVGKETLRLALADPAIELLAPTRRALPPAPRLVNPVDPAGEWVDAPWQADAVLCTLGTTIAKAGSQAAFTAIDHDLVLRLLRRAHAAGTPTAVLVSSLGASARGNFYLRTKHAVEEAAAAIGFRSLTILRPSMIDTERSESRPAERFGLLAMRGLAALIPRRYRAVPATRIAEAMLVAARVAAPGRQVIESEAI